MGLKVVHGILSVPHDTFIDMKDVYGEVKTIMIVEETMKDDKGIKPSTHKLNILLHMIAFPFCRTNQLYKDIVIQRNTEVQKRIQGPTTMNTIC